MKTDWRFGFRVRGSRLGGFKITVFNAFSMLSEACTCQIITRSVVLLVTVQQVQWMLVGPVLINV